MKKPSISKSRLRMAIGLVALCVSSRHNAATADLTYTMTVSSRLAYAPKASEVTARVYLAAGSKRVDITAYDALGSRTWATITRPDLGEVMTVDPKLQIYKTEPIYTFLQVAAFPNIPDHLTSNSADIPANTKSTLSATDYGDDLIGGRPADHLMITFHDVDLDHPANSSDVVLEYWAEYLGTGYHPNLHRTATSESGATLNYHQSGDKDLVDQLTQQVPAKIVVHSGNTKTEMYILNYTRAQLSSTLFSVPPSYEEVDATKFAELEAASMSSTSAP